MNANSANADVEEVRVTMPVALLDEIDELGERGRFGTRSRVVTEAIRQAADGDA